MITKNGKYKYKFAIKNGKEREQQVITNDLHDCLLQKDVTSFWKTWNSKCKTKSRTYVINGLDSPSDIAESFGRYFSLACTPDNTRNSLEKLKFEDDFKAYPSYSQNSKHFTVEMIDKVVYEMKKGKAAGADNITVEHIQYAHPSILVILCDLFNCMICLGFVPDAFGDGVTYPLLKENGYKPCYDCDSFRGITVSAVVSKIFEHCVLHKFQNRLASHQAQLGFKKGLSCSHAIFGVSQIVDTYVKGGSTVNLCTIDISKAFDKVNHYILLSKLMKRGLPKSLIELLHMWFGKSTFVVKWLGQYSSKFAVLCGVRQGGVLSPILFAIYVDELLHALHSSGLGCHLNGITFNSLMYADDLILMSASLSDLQSLINLCVERLAAVLLTVNYKKCYSVRIGKRFTSYCEPLTIGHVQITFVDEIRYLGVFIKSSHTLKFNLEHGKKKFYGCLNEIFRKVGNKELVVISLCNSFCIPMLLYGVDVMNLTKTEKQRLSSPFDRMFSRLFKTFDKNVIRYCQYYTSHLPLSYTIDLRRCRFLFKLRTCNNDLMRLLYNTANNYVNEICHCYNLLVSKPRSWHNALWLDFENGLFNCRS